MCYLYTYRMGYLQVLSADRGAGPCPLLSALELLLSLLNFVSKPVPFVMLRKISGSVD